MRFGTWLRGVRWYLRELTGETQYERYVQRQQARCGHVLLSRREFERRRIDRGDLHPGSRCC